MKTSGMSDPTEQAPSAGPHGRTAEIFAAHLATIGKDVTAWLALFADDAVIEFPYASAVGTPERLEGKRAIYEYMKDTPSQMLGLTFTDVRVQPALDANVVFAEVHGEATIASTGRLYRQDYVMRLETDGERIVRYREYWNPVPALAAFGGADAVRGTFASDGQKAGEP